MKGKTFGRVILLGGGAAELELLRRAFKECGHTSCHIFHSTSAALHYLAVTRVDVAVVDCLSIDMDVFDFLSRARALPGSGTCRIIVAGPGNYAESVRVGLLSKGADYYMIKPYKAQALFESIGSLAPGHRLAWSTAYDAAILRWLDRAGAPEQDTGYWYLASCLQRWLWEQEPPQLKAVYLEVARYYRISPKGVESGVHRMAQTLAQAAGQPRPLSNKAFLAEMAKGVWRELERENHAVRP